MPANLINKNTDTNRSATDKINKGIQDAFDSLERATTARQNSSEALVKSKKIETMVDTLIIHNGKSDAEVLQMRVDEDGIAHSTANARIISDTSKLSGKIAQSETKIKQTETALSNKISKTETDLSQRNVNVRNYGAVGDGVTSDSDAWQRALDIAKTQPVEIFVPNGTYRMTKELKIYSNTTIRCGSNVRVVRDHSGYLIVNGFRRTEETPTTAGGYNGHGNLKFIGGLYDGNGVLQRSKASIFHIIHADTVTVENATFKDVANSHHIEFNSSQNVYVNNCSFLGHVGTDTVNEAIQLDLAKKDLTKIGADDSTPCRNVWITNCYFGNSDTSGSNTIMRAIGSHTTTINRWHENIHIENNIIENTASFAIRALSWKNISIVNNKFNNCGAGINYRSPITSDGTTAHTHDENGVQTGRSQECSGAKISNNIFTGGGTAGRIIEIYGENTGLVKDVSVSFNTINSLAQRLDAIIFVWARECSCVGNDINGRGILTRDSSHNITVSGNVLDLIAGHGISATDNCAYINITGNTVKRVENNGIYINGGDSFVISANTISGANGANAAGDTYSHIRLVSSVTRASITGNVCRNYSTSHTLTHALYVTSACTYVTTGMNVFQGFTAYNGATGGTIGATGDLT
ncbi:MAG: glycosyl hydrolase family 28-related protein [Bacillaceae bacterium]